MARNTGFPSLCRAESTGSLLPPRYTGLGLELGPEVQDYIGLVARVRARSTGLCRARVRVRARSTGLHRARVRVRTGSRGLQLELGPGSSSY